MPTESLPELLTLEAALAHFRAQGFDLLLAEVEVDMARAEERMASAVINPSANFGVGKTLMYDRDECPGCSAVIWNAGLSDEGAVVDILSGKRGLRRRVARAAVEAAKSGRADAQRTLEAAVKYQYVEAARAQAALALSLEVAQTTQQTLDLVTAHWKAGAASGADLARADTEKLEADQSVDEAAGELRASQIALAMLIGIRGLVPTFEVDASILDYVVPTALEAPSREGLLRSALAHRPDLVAAKRQLEQAEAMVDLSKRERFPEIAFSVDYTQQGFGSNAPEPPTLSFGISTPLPLFYQQQGEVAKAAAELRGQALLQRKAEAQVASDVEAALVAFRSARTRVERMERQLLLRAQEARDLVAIQYEKGAASLLELIDAQRTLISTRESSLQNLTDYWTAVFQIEEAIGMEIGR